MVYKHLVLSGGSWKGLYMLGVIDNFLKEKYINFEQIETIYATSVGTLIATLIALKIEWESVINYFINVPIKQLDNLNLDMCISMFNDCGILDKNFFIKLLGSFFKSKYLDFETITLIDFYKYSNIELNLFAIEFDTMNTINFNHHNNPDIKLLDALYSSCTFPYLFKPCKLNNKIYLDGGINVHYPSKYCLEKHENDEIFGIYIRTKSCLSSNVDNMLNFGISLIYKIIFTNQMENLKELKNQIIIDTEGKMVNTIIELVKNKDLREDLINNGREFSEIYIKQQCLKTD
jgi:NTE family protein